MKCRVCGTEIGEQIYCPMCGAAVNPEQGTESEQQEVVQPDNSYKYQGIDTDATTVLTVNSIGNESEKENNNEEKCVISGEVELPKKSHKKLIIILSIIAGVLLIAGISIFCYFHYIYPNKITYLEKSIYFVSKGEIANEDGLKLDASYKSSKEGQLIQANYENDTFLYMGTDGKSIEKVTEEKNIKAEEEEQIVSIIADNAISKVYYWTERETNVYSLHCIGEKEPLKRHVTGVTGTVISQNGEYLAYSYKAEEDAYVVCEIVPSGEINQIATLESTARVIGVTDEGDVFCELQNKSNGNTEEGEEEELTYTIYCVQDKKSYGSNLAQIQYFGYYSELDSFVIKTADKAIYYVNTGEAGEERLIATNVDWFADISEPCKYECSCDREAVLAGGNPKTLRNTTPHYYYLKEDNLYSYDILNDSESKKVVGDFGEAYNIEIWNNELIFYMEGEKLYSCEKIEEEWQEAKLLAKECVSYQYSPEKKCTYYLADGTLYSYEDGKEQKISNKVKSFDLNLEDGILAYNTDTSLIISKKEEEEYAVKSDGQVLVIEDDVYYTDKEKTLYKLSGETGETEKVADMVETIMYIWK